MFFFLRCIFWLSIVYASMSWPNGTFGPAIPRLPDLGARAIEMGQAEVATLGARGLAATTGAGIAELCHEHRAECLDGAARLTSLVSAGDVAGGAPPTLPVAAQDAAAIPLPVPDPRRAIRGAKRREAP